MAVTQAPWQRSFDDLGRPLAEVTFVVLDLETTGTSPATCAITEVGAVKVRGGELLGTFQKLIDNGGSLIVIEHNLDVIKAADWVIDLGPEGGGAGGHVVAAGTPETIAAVTEGYTGRYLREAMEA